MLLQVLVPAVRSMLSRRVLLVPRDALRLLPRVLVHCMLLEPEDGTPGCAHGCDPADGALTPVCLIEWRAMRNAPDCTSLPDLIYVRVSLLCRPPCMPLHLGHIPVVRDPIPVDHHLRRHSFRIHAAGVARGQCLDSLCAS